MAPRGVVENLELGELPVGEDAVALGVETVGEALALGPGEGGEAGAANALFEPCSCLGAGAATPAQSAIEIAVDLLGVGRPAALALEL